MQSRYLSNTNNKQQQPRWQVIGFERPVNRTGSHQDEPRWQNTTNGLWFVKKEKEKKERIKTAPEQVIKEPIDKISLMNSKGFIRHL